MVWAIGVALVLAGTLVIIYAMQGKWPIAPIALNSGQGMPLATSAPRGAPIATKSEAG